MGPTWDPFVFNQWEADLDEFGVVTSGRRISDLRYADDTVILVNGDKDPTEALNKVVDAGNARCLNLNAKKTKWMSLGDQNARVIVNGEEIERVGQFKYLGSIKTDNGDCAQDIRTRVAMAKKRVQDLTSIWRSRGIRKSVKMSIVKCLVWPILLYGCEAWSLTEANKRKIEAAELWVYRRLLCINWRERRTNESVLGELGVERKLLGLVKRRKLSFFGHACRGGGLVKDVICGYHPGKRRRGRPRRQYFDDITDWLGSGKNGAVQATRDRGK